MSVPSTWLMSPRARGMLLLSLAFSGQAAAQSLSPVVVTATRDPRPMNEALSDVTVIDADAIRGAGAMTLPELLQAEGGIEISQNGAMGSVSGIFVRGTKTAQTVILVDGVRLENPLGGGGNLELLPLSAIDRIEILRGPASALYGSGAIGGVIQIFTRAGMGPPKANASVAIGSRGARLARGGLSGALGDDGRTRFSIGMAAERADGFEVTNPASSYYQADRDGFRYWSADASLTHRFGTSWEAGLNLISTAGRSEYDDAFSTPDTALKHHRVRTTGAWIQGQPAQPWRTTLRVGDTLIAYRFDAFAFAPEVATRTLSWQNTWAMPIGRVLFGYEQTGQRIEGEGVSDPSVGYTRLSRITRSPFVGYEAQAGRHLYRAHLRRDAIEAVDAQTTGSLAYGYRTGSGWLLRGSYGTAFRAPTFDDLYSPFGANPNLRPERSRGGEVALERHQGDNRLRATLFAHRIREAIELDQTFQPQNLSEARVRGLTLDAKQAFRAFNFGGTLTMQRAHGETIDALTGQSSVERLPRRARVFGALTVQWREGPWRAMAQWVAQGHRVDTNGARLAGYGLLNASLGYALDSRWELFIRGNNLGDKRFQTAHGFSGAPRMLMVGVRWSGG